MNLILDTFNQTGDIGHAYLLVDSGNIIKEKLKNFLFKNFSDGNIFECHIIEKTTFGIGDARELKLLQSKKNIGNKQFFIISPDHITREAQNALLKVFEEPTAGTHFFLILPFTEMVVPTLRSRMTVVDEGGSGNPDIQNAVKFVTLPVAKRLNMALDISKSQDRAEVAIFLNSLEMSLTQKKTGHLLAEDYIKLDSVLGEIRKARAYLNTNRGNTRMLLENIALLLP